MKWQRWNPGDCWEVSAPVRPEQDGGAAAVSVVAGEARCGGMGQVHSLQELLQGSEALDPPALMADWREEGFLHGNPAYQKTADRGEMIY